MLQSLALFLCAFLAIGSNAGEFQIVVNKGNTVTKIDISDLKRIYTGRRSELDGDKVVPVNQPLDSAITESFLAATVGMTPQEYKEYWLAQQVKGLATAPVIQRTDAAVIAMVSQLPGAIGYVSTDADISKVKKVVLE